MSTHYISVQLTEHVLTVSIERPDRKNALNNAMYEQLAAAIERATSDADVHVVLLKGLPDVFSSGNEIDEFLQTPMSLETAPVIRLQMLMTQLFKPVVVAVRGAAVGFGATILLHCDLVYAGTSAQFSMPFTRLGLCPEAAASLLLPRVVGYAKAAEILLLGEPFDAHTALQIGLINQVMPDNELDDFAYKQAQKLAALSPHSIQATKRLLREKSAPDVQAAIQEEGAVFIDLLKQPYAQQVLSAFKNKRQS
jgi:enoyl-CoA hydratase/carnithine racemase